MNSVPLAQEAKWNYKHFNMDMDKAHITLCLSQNAGTNTFRILALKSFRGVAYTYDFTIHALEIQPDHVHLFVEFPPHYSVSQVVQLFKGISAYRILHQFPALRNTFFRRGHFWSAGKFYRSVGNVTADTIQHYIQQSQHGWLSEHQATLSA